MAGIVLRVRLTSGDQIDVVYDEPDSTDEGAVAERAISALADPRGSLRCTHGGRLVVVYARGVAVVEVAPRGAVL